MSDFDIAYSSLTDCYYVVIGKEKYDITNFVKDKIQQGRVEAIDELYSRLTDKYCGCCNTLRDTCAKGNDCLIYKIAEELKNE